MLQTFTDSGHSDFEYWNITYTMPANCTVGNVEPMIRLDIASTL